MILKYIPNIMPIRICPLSSGKYDFLIKMIRTGSEEICTIVIQVMYVIEHRPGLTAHLQENLFFCNLKQ
jgi:hypothetical protein